MLLNFKFLIDFHLDLKYWVLGWLAQQREKEIKFSKDIACAPSRARNSRSIMKCVPSYVSLIAQNYSIINRRRSPSAPGSCNTTKHNNSASKHTSECGRSVMMRSARSGTAASRELPQVFTLIIFIMTDTLYWVSEWLERCRVNVGWVRGWMKMHFIVTLSFIRCLCQLFNIHLFFNYELFWLNFAIIPED